MNRPINTYTPGDPLPIELHAIGRPVTLFTGAGLVIAGTITHVWQGTDGALTYEIKAAGGGNYVGQRLGDLNNPQPNTFTYAP